MNVFQTKVNVEFLNNLIRKNILNKFNYDIENKYTNELIEVMKKINSMTTFPVGTSDKDKVIQLNKTIVEEMINSLSQIIGQKNDKPVEFIPEKPIIKTRVEFVDSRKRNYELFPQVNNFGLPLFKCQELISVDILTAEIPRIQYAVNENNNKLYLNGKEVVIPTGDYSETLLASTIDEIFNELESGYSVITNTFLNKYVIKNEKNFNIDFRDKSINHVLGFHKALLKDKNEYTSTGMYDLTGENCLYIYFIIKNNEYLLGKMVLDVPNKCTKYFHKDGYHSIGRSFQPHITEIANDFTVQFRSYDGSLYDFVGREISMTISFEYC